MPIHFSRGLLVRLACKTQIFSRFAWELFIVWLILNFQKTQLKVDFSNWNSWQQTGMSWNIHMSPTVLQNCWWGWHISFVCDIRNMEVPNYSIWCRLHVHSVMSMAEVLPSKRSFVRLLTLPWRCRLAMPSGPLWSSTRYDLKSCWRRPLASYKYLCIYIYIYIYLSLSILYVYPLAFGLTHVWSGLRTVHIAASKDQSREGHAQHGRHQERMGQWGNVCCFFSFPQFLPVSIWFHKKKWLVMIHAISVMYSLLVRCPLESAHM